MSVGGNRLYVNVAYGYGCIACIEECCFRECVYVNVYVYVNVDML